MISLKKKHSTLTSVKDPADHSRENYEEHGQQL